MKGPSPLPGRYHRGQLRDLLLRRAEEVLARDGLEAVTLRGLARDVGVSHAAPTRHFSDKAALLDALAEIGFGRLSEVLDAAVDAGGTPSTFQSRLTELAQTYVDFALRNGALLAIMFEAKNRASDSSPLTEAVRRAFAAPLALIVEGQTRQDVVDGDPDRVAAGTWAAIHGLASMASIGLIDVDDLPVLVPETVERIMTGLSPRLCCTATASVSDAF